MERNKTTKTTLAQVFKRETTFLEGKTSQPIYALNNDTFETTYVPLALTILAKALASNMPNDEYEELKKDLVSTITYDPLLQSWIHKS